MKANFDIIQEKIKKHKSLNEALRQKKLELDSALEDAKEKRKNLPFTIRRITIGKFPL